MKIEHNQLEQLLCYQELELETSKLRLKITEMATGKSLEALRDEILQLSQVISQERINYEELERENTRILGDLKLVDERISRDKYRLNKTAVSRDALGIQHELETLSKRKSELEEMELALLEKLDISRNQMEGNNSRRLELERGFNQAKEDLKQQLMSEKTTYEAKLAAARGIRESLDAALIELYEKKKVRGVAVGRMLRNTCGACNMGLTASAAHDLLSKPSDELVTCPECNAILVRN